MADRSNNHWDENNYGIVKKKKSVKKRSKRRNNFAIFYIITMIIGIVVCVTLFAVAYQTLVPSRIIAPPTADNELIDFVRAEYDKVVGMVTDINTFAPRSLSLLILETGRTEQFSMTDATTIQNRHGSNIGFGEINLGQIVDVTFDANSRDMSAINANTQAWEQQHRGNFTVNIDNSTMAIGNQVYDFSSRTLVLNRGEPASISILNPEDVITIVGHQNKIWSIRIDSGHGFIRFENADRVTNGTVSVGNFIFTALDGTTQLSSIEGMHRVVVEGQNIQPFRADAVVRQGETVTISLEDVVFRKGTLQIILDEPEATVLINGEVVELVNFLTEVEYGTHLLRIEGPGIVPIQQEFEMNQSFMRLDLNLTNNNQAFQILVETFPTDAQLFLNGTLIGVSPQTIEVERGTNQLIARKAGYEDRVQNFVADANTSRNLLLHLTQSTMVVPSPSPTPAQTEEPPAQDLLPPLPSDWNPIPAPSIPAPWEVTIPEQTGQPPETVPEQTEQPPETVPDWPPSSDELPTPLPF